LNNKDAIGQALLDYYNNQVTDKLIVKSDISEDDEIPIHYLFRTERQLPKLEKKALALCKGHIIDVGAASGVHSLILQEKELQVTSIDTSKGAIQVMKKRGVKNPKHQDFYQLQNQKYDTILMLMNGAGLAGTVEGLTQLLNKAKELLTPKGQILLDSSDIKYMFEEEDGSMWIDLNAAYYGEVNYQMQYKNYLTKPFNWLFIDFGKLKDTAKLLGWNCELIQEGSHHDYLARLTVNIDN